MNSQIPCEFFLESWEDADHPMACVDLNNQFVRVNHSFERLLGYSDPELKGRTWMELTRPEHVGGDLASVQAVMEGVTDSYRMEKDYRHKRGHYVPVVLMVRRFPRNPTLELLFFRIESPVASATRVEVSKVEQQFTTQMGQLADRISTMEDRGFVQVGDQWRDGDKVGRNKTSNSDGTIKVLGACIVAMALAVTWIAYYVATMKTETPPATPPTITMPASGE